MSNRLAREFVAQAIEQVRNRDHRAALVTLDLLTTILETGDDMPKPRVALLLSATGQHFVCDELHSDGRVHVIPDAKYGMFNRQTMELDFCKVAQHVLEIVYEGDDWPAPLRKPTAEQVLKHFGV
jgi:hypothetical protein